MFKPSENRSNNLAEDKKSDQNPHLSDEQLLLALDGELSAHGAAEVEDHVASCWACRARREQIEKVIGDVVDYRDQLVQPYFSFSTGRRSRFINQLDQLAASIGRPPLWKRLLSVTRGLWTISQIEMPRYVWIGAPFVAILAFFSFTRLWHLPKVSASELLENAQSSEALAIRSVTKPVVYQKLRIRVGSGSVTRTMYRDPVGMRRVGHLDVVEGDDQSLAGDEGFRSEMRDQPNAVKAADAELRRTFLTAHLSWEDPLSPSNYSAWYKSLDDKVDEVTAVGNDLITLKTTTSEGPIAEASITVRTTDFHPVEEDLRLQDARQVEIQEIAWEVLPMEAINEAIFEPETTPASLNKRPANPPVLPAAVSDAELAEAELRARVAIHAEKADLGEPIELDRDIAKTGQPSVIVRGIVNTSDRKNDLLAALQGIPHVELRLQTMEEAQAQQDLVPTDERQDVTPQVTQSAPVREYDVPNEGIEATRHEPVPIVVIGSSAFEQQLEARFPIAKNRTTFVNETVELVQNAMAQAWALRRLRDRYTPDMVAELSSEAQQTLELLIRDHVSELRQDVDDVRVRVLPLLSPTTMIATSPSASEATLSPATTASDWRGTAMSVFSETQKVNDNGSALLAGSRETLSDPQAAVRELQLALVDLETQVPLLYQQVREAFLSESRNSGR